MLIIQPDRRYYRPRYVAPLRYGPPRFAGVGSSETGLGSLTQNEQLLFLLGGAGGLTALGAFVGAYAGRKVLSLHPDWGMLAGIFPGMIVGGAAGVLWLRSSLGDVNY
jgi:hypothetical protein